MLVKKFYFTCVLVLVNLYLVLSLGFLECEDKNGVCLAMKAKGWCEYRKEIMNIQCRKTCGFCETDEKEVAQANNIDLQSPDCDNVYDYKKCAYFRHMGWCEKRDQIRENCKKTCVCEMQNAKPTKPSCERSQYGCCDDKITVKTDKKGKECPAACKDDAAYVVLCRRFSSECNGASGGLTTSVQRHCRKTCNKC